MFRAEGEGFEPSVGEYPTPVFKTGAFNRSATLPRSPPNPFGQKRDASPNLAVRAVRVKPSIVPKKPYSDFISIAPVINVLSGTFLALPKHRAFDMPTEVDPTDSRTAGPYSQQHPPVNQK